MEVRMRALGRTLQIAALVAALGGLTHVSAAVQKTTPEPTLKDRIEFGLETSTIVKKYDINVKVNGTEATLTGKVGTAEQKTEAVRLAKVAGATKVQDGIVVDADADRTVSERMKAGMNKTGDKISDTWITTKVKWFFWGDDRLRGSDISVSTTDHVVTLKGTVRNLDGRTRAVQLATDTEGVKRVIDELTIAK
jgi:hyperosmotically inducible protein